MSVPKDVVQAVVAALGKELHLLSDDDRRSSESRATVAGVLPVWWRAAFREQQDTADEGFWQITWVLLEIAAEQYAEMSRFEQAVRDSHDLLVQKVPEDDETRKLNTLLVGTGTHAPEAYRVPKYPARKADFEKDRHEDNKPPPKPKGRPSKRACVKRVRRSQTGTAVLYACTTTRSKCPRDMTRAAANPGLLLYFCGHGTVQAVDVMSVRLRTRSRTVSLTTRVFPVKRRAAPSDCVHQKVNHGVGHAHRR